MKSMRIILVAMLFFVGAGLWADCAMQGELCGADCNGKCTQCVDGKCKCMYSYNEDTGELIDSSKKVVNTGTYESLCPGCGHEYYEHADDWYSLLKGKKPQNSSL